MSERHAQHRYIGDENGRCVFCTRQQDSIHHVFAQKDPVNLVDEEAAIREKINLELKAGGFITKDSGERKQFASGMVRDVNTGKLPWHALTDGPMAKRWVGLLGRGKVKYPDVAPGVPNWTLADGPEELARFKESAFRHFMQWYLDETDEDHAAATFFNINGAEFVKEKINEKK